MFSIIKELIDFKYEIRMKPELMQLVIMLKKETKGNKFELIQRLPLQDHFNEAKIVGCIKFMKDKIDNKIKENDLTEK